MYKNVKRRLAMRNLIKKICIFFVLFTLVADNNFVFTCKENNHSIIVCSDDDEIDSEIIKTY